MALIGTMKYLTIGDKTYEIEGEQLSIASASTLGGIKVGSGLSIDSTTGVLSASITETDPVYSASAASGITSSDISNWNSKTSNTGTITSVKTTAGAHTTIDVSSGAANFNVPTATSHLTNDSGFITSFTDENVTNTAVTAATTYYLTGSTSSSTATGGLSKHAAIKAYVTANSGTGGSARIDLGNTTATTSAGGKEGIIRLYGTSATYYVELKAGAPSANRTISFPNKGGTVALTDDIPTISYPVTSVNNKTGAVSLSASDVGALPSSTTYVSTITTSAGIHSVISNQSGTVSFNVPTNTSHLTNDSGFVRQFKVTITQNNDTYSADKTFTEIQTAYNNGYEVICQGPTGSMMPVLEIGSTNAFFELSAMTAQGIPAAEIVTITSNNTVSHSMTMYEETDPIFSTSAAAGITTTDISNWNAKVSDDKTWNGVSLTTGNNVISESFTLYVPVLTSSTGTSAKTIKAVASGTQSTSANNLVRYNENGYLMSRTPSANDNSTKVATTAYVDSAVGSVQTTSAQIIRW